MRKTIVAGNWKMNASKESVNTLIEGILSGMNETSSEVSLCSFSLSLPSGIFNPRL